MIKMNSNNSSFQQVATDIVDLFELQMQLISVDSQVARRKAMTAIACAAVAAGLSGSALTTLMVGAGFLLHELAGWTTGASLLAVAVGIFIIAAILFVVALKAIQKASAAMNETKSEFTENLKWLKAVLVSPKTSPRNQIREESFPFSDTPPAMKR